MAPRFRDFYYNDYFFGPIELDYKPIQVPKLLTEASITELEAQLKKLKDEQARVQERTKLLPLMKWHNVMRVHHNSNDGVPMTFYEIAAIAHKLGYKYFVVDGWNEVYEVGQVYVDPSFKTSMRHYKALPVVSTEVK